MNLELGLPLETSWKGLVLGDELSWDLFCLLMSSKLGPLAVTALVLSVSAVYCSVLPIVGGTCYDRVAKGEAVATILSR